MHTKKQKITQERIFSPFEFSLEKYVLNQFNIAEELVSSNKDYHAAVSMK